MVVDTSAIVAMILREKERFIFDDLILRTPTVVMFPGGNPSNTVSFGCGFLEFLVALFSAKLKPEIFPNAELLGKTPVFIKQAWLG